MVLPQSGTTEEATQRAAQPVLTARELELRFGGLKALDGLSLEVADGELVGIIGPNGAGKSTFFNVVSGLVKPASGRVVFEGRDITGASPSTVARAGIGRKLQVPNVFEELTVQKNLAVASRGKSSMPSLLTGGREQSSSIEATLELLGLQGKAEHEARSLSHGEKQWLEIGMVLANEPKLLLLDEPTAGMTIQETHRTEEMLRDLASGHTIVVIEHDVKFIRGVADRVVVMHRGRVLTSGLIDEVEADQTVRDVYLGRVG